MAKKKQKNWHDLLTTTAGALMGTAMVAPQVIQAYQGQRASGTMIGLGLGTAFLSYFIGKKPQILEGQ